MANILQQLQDEQAMLLMYLADELPAADREAVERRLAGDARLAEELQKMRQTHETYISAMRRLDEAEGQPISQAVASRQASRLIRQWQARRLAQPSVAARRRKAPIWVYPLAAAAVVVAAVTGSVWFGMRTPSSSQIVYRQQIDSSVIDSQRQQSIALLDKSLSDDPADSVALAPADSSDESLLPWDPSFVGERQK